MYTVISHRMIQESLAIIFCKPNILIKDSMHRRLYEKHYTHIHTCTYIIITILKEVPKWLKFLRNIILCSMHNE